MKKKIEKRIKYLEAEHDMYLRSYYAAGSSTRVYGQFMNEVAEELKVLRIVHRAL